MYRIFFIALFSWPLLLQSACGGGDGSPASTTPYTGSNPTFPDDKCTAYNEADPDGDGPKEAPDDGTQDGTTDLCKTLPNGKRLRFTVDNHAGCLLQTMAEMDFLPCD